jgi:UTP--glucose-1-phosphate uridylyltransferase
MLGLQKARSFLTGRAAQAINDGEGGNEGKAEESSDGRATGGRKAMPKEMLPVVDKPLIQYAVEECIGSGIENIIFVTGRRKNAIEDHFDSAPELEQFLEARGRAKEAKMVREISGGLHFSYTHQSEALGLGHAVLTARELVGDEPFAVLLGDVIMDGKIPATRSLVEIYEATGVGAIAVEEVPRERLHFYGIVDAAPEKQKQNRWGARLLRIKVTPN